eukprot:COSAG01_NODE_9254_length_2498_cov_3.106533_1_plen_118_part_10
MRACVRAARAVQARVEALEEALERLREECGFRTKEAAQLRMQVRDRVVWLVPSETGVTPLPLQLNSCWLAPRSRGPRLACTQDPGAAARRCWPRAGGARGVVVVPVPSRSSTVARAVY